MFSKTDMYGKEYPFHFYDEIHPIAHACSTEIDDQKFKSDVKLNVIYQKASCILLHWLYIQNIQIKKLSSEKIQLMSKALIKQIE